ncbi:two-component sensor histidine kinase [Cystobacter fuscus]|uniref:Signal transduction histidine-protein kinase/phosphatase MprB n=1 Tax=Cystobacter fuscus TaxID=43 RepID=A0A250J8F9_9BACT|nr:ATP-binding protein [Cystobacter fuscus]ATB39486.1 two-component sensor histidine kinase [Cystobacter fuscus]
MAIQVQDPAPPPARFRRQLLTVMLLTGLVPLVALGVLMWQGLEVLLSISLAPVEQVLEAFSTGATPAEQSQAALDEARLNLAQAELARRSLVRWTPRLFGVLLLVSAAALTGAAVLLGRALTRPVSILTQGMWAYSRGDLSRQLPAPDVARDELQFLLVQFNRMGQELAAQRERLKSSERIAAWQDVARALAHELRNPLTAMRLALARLSRADAPPDATRLAEAVALLDEELELLSRMTRSFSDFARLPAPRFQPVALRPLLAEVCALYAPTSPVAVELLAGPEPHLSADPDGLRRLFGNLLKNALEASSPGAAPVRLSIETQPSRLRVLLRDGGAGITRVVEGDALTRGLFSTKPEGSGLGLPIAQKIAHEHGGSLRLEPLPEGGTLALVELPLG